jgi:hypothetical protein
VCFPQSYNSFEPNIDALHCNISLSETIDSTQFVTTRVCSSSFPTSDSISCVGCRAYSDSLQLSYEQQDDSCAAGWCVHTAIAPQVVLAYLQLSKSDGSSFCRYLSQELSTSSTYVAVTQHGIHKSYLVFASIEDAACERVQSHSVCTITQNPGSVYVNCDSVRCRRGKNKNLSNLSTFDSLCCHLRVLVPQLGLVNETFCDSIDSGVCVCVIELC